MFHQELEFLQSLYIKQINGEDLTTEDKVSYSIICEVLEDNSIINPFPLEI